MGKVEGTLNCDEIEGLLEPCGLVTERTNVLVACSVGSSVHGKLPIRVANLTPEPQILREGTSLGGFSVLGNETEGAVVANLN